MKLPDLEIFHFLIFFSDHGNPDKTQAVNSNFVSENPSNLYCIIIDRKVYCEKGDISASTMLSTSTLDKQRICVNTQLKSSKKQLK